MQFKSVCSLYILVNILIFYQFDLYKSFGRIKSMEFFIESDHHYWTKPGQAGLSYCEFGDSLVCGPAYAILFSRFCNLTGKGS